MAEQSMNEEHMVDAAGERTSSPMPPRLQHVVNLVEGPVATAFGEGTITTIHYRDELTLRVDREMLHELIAFLKNDPGLAFVMLKDVHVIDWARRRDRFEVDYNLYSLEHKARLRVSCFTQEKDPHVDSVTDLFRSADWYEREAYDMHGVIFDNHPDLRRMYMPEDFVHPETGEPLYPMRKDFPVMGIPGSLPLPERDGADKTDGVESGLPH